MASQGGAGGLRARIYDAAILSLTTHWYAEVLDRVPEGATLLDVGIGTGGALAGNADRVREKNLRVVGIDIDGDYVARCTARLGEAGLADHVEARLESVYEHHGGPYDAIYFSASFMLLPDPQKALDHVGHQLSESGRLYFTQTFENERSAFMERLKPMLRTLTTIDFGKVTYEDDFRAELARANVTIEELTRLGGTRARSYFLAVGRAPASSAEDAHGSRIS